jgi:VCBS repeat-containing protein
VVTVNPLQGTLGVSGRNLVYTPNENFTGADSISFKVNDGALDSTPAVVSITVNPVNDAPVAIAGTATVNEDGSVNITLTGSDVDAGEVLTFSKATDPANGLLSVVNGIATYIPNANYNGSDSFTFRANDGDVDSAPATVSITVTPVDDRPVANPQSVSVNEDGSLQITLTGSDVDGDTLFFTIPGKPPHGNVTLSGAVATYIPDPNYNGPDSISFFVYSIVSGTPVFSLSASVSITVNPVNDVPVALAQAVSVNEDTAVNITLAGSDVEGSVLTFSAGPASHGSVSLAGSVVTYTAAPNYSGPDSFTFTVTDGTAVSAPATVSITVLEVAEPGFGDWLAGFSLSADPQTDSDGDSINNAVEYVIGGNPATQPDTALLPTLEMASANLDGNPGDEEYLVFTYRRTDLARDDPSTDIQVEWSAGLAGSWGATTGMVEQVTDGDGIDSVKVFIPRALAAGGRLFARLAVQVSTTSEPE